MISFNDNASKILSELNNQGDSTSIVDLFTSEEFMFSKGQICVPILVGVKLYETCMATLRYFKLFSCQYAG